MEGDASVEVLDGAGVAAPAFEGVDFDVGDGQQVFCEATADWSGDSCDEDAHVSSSGVGYGLWLRGATIAWFDGGVKRVVVVVCCGCGGW